MDDEKIKRTKGGVVHPRVMRAMLKLGQDISHARRVRRITADDFAARIGIARATLHRLETGDPGIALNTLALALHAIGRLDALADLADPASDHVTMMQMKEEAPRRITKQRIRHATYDDYEDTEEPGEEPPEAESKFKGF